MSEQAPHQMSAAELDEFLNSGIGRPPSPEAVAKYTDHIAELEAGERQGGREIGHTVLADGFAVQGLRVPGRNEVVTAQGVLRTRTTPRSSNS